MARSEPVPLTGAQPGATTAPGAVDEVDLTPVRTYWELVRQRFVQHRLAVVALFLMITLIAIAVIVPFVTGDAFGKTNLELINRPPTLTAPLGYDDIGINIFIRLTKALQTSLLVGAMAV